MAKVHVHLSTSIKGSRPSLETELATMGAEERIQQLQNLERLWLHADLDRSNVDKVVARAELEKLLGTDELSRWYGGQLMYSLTPDGKQFRCWYAPFGHVSWHRDWKTGAEHDYHVDSCGRGLLYGIVGEADDVTQYVTSLTRELLRGELRFGGDVVVHTWLGWGVFI